MKHLFAPLALVLLGLLSACTSVETSLKATHVPRARLMFDNDNSGGSATLTIVRDRSMSGSICYYAIKIDDKLMARIGASEKAVFRFEPGDRKVQITRDPQGDGLCALGDDETTKSLTLEANENKYYRLSTDMSGAPELKALAVPTETVVR